MVNPYISTDRGVFFVYFKIKYITLNIRPIWSYMVVSYIDLDLSSPFIISLHTDDIRHLLVNLWVISQPYFSLSFQGRYF